MSEWNHPETEEDKHPETVSEETEAPRRRRRSDRYSEDREPEEEAAQETRRNVISSRSETAREVASRYARQREDDGFGDTRRVPSQGAGSGREQVGYAPGRMGMTPSQRARMSEAGRARLAEETQRGNAAAQVERNIRYTEPRQGAGGPQKEPPRGGRRGLTAVIIMLLLIGALLVMLLATPDDADGFPGSLRRQIQSLFSRETPQEREIISFAMGGQDRTGVLFSVVTEKDVADVRLTDANGDVLVTSRNISEQENRLYWELVWQPESVYSGVVRLQVMGDEGWTDTEFSADVLADAAPGTEPEVTDLPVTFATEEPTFTPVPTQTPAPAAETEEPAPEEDLWDAEIEGEGENGNGAEAEPEESRDLAWQDPDDPEGAEDGSEGVRASAEENYETGAFPEYTPEETAAVTASADGGENPEAGTAGTEEAEPEQRKILTVTAAESADPSLIAASVIYNGSKKVPEYARSDKEKIHMPTLGEYSRTKIGVLTFRSDAFRQNAAVGTVKGMDSLKQVWKAEAGSVKGSGQTYYGIGWVGQPAIVKWSQQVREQSEIYEAKKEKSGLKEVIMAGQDGNIYFLDLADGEQTRNSIKLGYPMKAAPSVHPGGEPYMTVGQFARKMARGTGTIGLRQYNLYKLKELSLIDGLDGKNNRPYNQVGSFETSALIDRTTKTLVTAGTNGLLYVINLNSEFDYNMGTYTQSPTTVVLKTKAKGEKETATAVEASVAMYDRYVYYADMGGFLRCVDTNTLTVAWAVSLGDAVESTPALDWHGENGLDLYAATELSARKSGDAEVRCFDALTGEERWTAAFGVKKDTKNKTVSGFRASPVVGQNALSEYVYYTVNNLSEEGRERLGVSESAALIALRKDDGSTVWARGLAGCAYSSPVAVYDENGNGAVIQCCGDGSVLLMDGETGEVRDTLQIDGTIEASPAVYDGMMVIGTTEKNKNNIYGIQIQ